MDSVILSKGSEAVYINELYNQAVDHLRDTSGSSVSVPCMELKALARVLVEGREEAQYPKFYAVLINTCLSVQENPPFPKWDCEGFLFLIYVS